MVVNHGNWHHAGMKTPDWDDLRHFLAVLDAGTLSGAARALHVEHTTVSRRIDALETALGFRLFDRLPKGWILTREGEHLEPLARRVEEDMQALLRSASATTPLQGTVRVSGPPAIVAHVIGPCMQALLQRLPDIDIELQGDMHLVDLMRREADIAIRFQRPRAPDMVVRQLAVLPYALYAHRDYLARTPEADWTFLGTSDERGEDPAILPQHAWLEQIRGTRRCPLRTNSLSTLATMAAAGIGVTVLPDAIGARMPELVRIEHVPCPVSRPLWILMHRDMRRSPRIKAVADAIGTLFGTPD